MDNDKENLPPIERNISWSERSVADKIAYLGSGIEQRSVILEPGYQNHLNVGYYPDLPQVDNRYLDFAARIKDAFDKFLGDYLEEYKDSFEVDIVMNGNKCFVFPGSFEQHESARGPGKPLDFVDIKSLLFYLGVSNEKFESFWGDFDNFRINKLRSGNEVVAAQLVARELGKEVRVRKPILREDNRIMGVEPAETPFYPSNPTYKTPQRANYERAKLEGEDFWVNEPNK